MSQPSIYITVGHPFEVMIGPFEDIQAAAAYMEVEVEDGDAIIIDTAWKLTPEEFKTARHPPGESEG